MYALQAKTATALEQYKQQVARANGAETYAAPFEVRPAVTNKLIDRYQKETEFLNKINMIQVRDQAGQKLGLGANRTIASTTDTAFSPVALLLLAIWRRLMIIYARQPITTPPLTGV